MVIRKSTVSNDWLRQRAQDHRNLAATDPCPAKNEDIFRLMQNKLAEVYEELLDRREAEKTA